MRFLGELSHALCGARLWCCCPLPLLMLPLRTHQKVVARCCCCCCCCCCQAVLGVALSSSRCCRRLRYCCCCYCCCCYCLRCCYYCWCFPLCRLSPSQQPLLPLPWIARHAQPAVELLLFLSFLLQLQFPSPCPLLLLKLMHQMLRVQHRQSRAQGSDSRRRCDCESVSLMTSLVGVLPLLL